MDSKTNGKRKLQTETPDGDSSDFEDGELRLDRKDTKVWLVKIPSFLYEQWTALPKAGVELGRLKIFKEPTRLSNGKQEPKVSMSLPSASSEPGSQWAAGLPKNYNLRFTNTAPVNEFVFTEDAQGRATEVVGKIQHEATIGPVVDDDYRRIMQERTELATTKARFSQFMDAKESKSQGFKAGRDDTSSGFGIMRKKDQLLDKKERLPRSAVLDILFAEFEKYPYWTFKGLAERTNQPHAWLKECLMEVAMLNKRGPYTGMYQLLPEYRQKQPQPSTSPTANPSLDDAMDEGL